MNMQGHSAYNSGCKTRSMDHVSDILIYGELNEEDERNRIEQGIYI